MKPVRVPYADTWGAMEELQRSGLVKRIGVCNLNVSLLRDVLSYAQIRPAVHQVEMHPFLNQQRLLKYCRSENIEVEAYSPLGAESYIPLDMADEVERVLEHPTIAEISSAHRKTSAQVLLRWATQRGTVPISKTQSARHLRENIDIDDFELTGKQMQQIDALERNRRFNDPADFGEKAFNTFYPIFD